MPIKNKITAILGDIPSLLIQPTPTHRACNKSYNHTGGPIVKEVTFSVIGLGSIEEQNLVNDLRTCNPRAFLSSVPVVRFW